MRNKLNVFLLSGSKMSSVSLGYFNNYLGPRGLAVRSSKSVESSILSFKEKEANRKLQSEEIASKLNGQSIYFACRSVSGGLLRDRVSVADVVKLINDQFNIHVDKSGIDFKKIVSYGVFNLRVHVGHLQYANMFIVISDSIENAKKLGEADK